MPNVRVCQFVFENATFSIPGMRACQFVLEIGTAAIPPSVSCNNPPNGEVNVAYTHALIGSGGLAPYTYAIIAPQLPPGLTLGASTGIISGIPTIAGTYTFTVQITDSNLNSSTVTCTIVILPQPVRITFRGIKRVKCAEGEGDTEVSEVPELPSVDRAV
jgi:hypothetical protein